MLHSIFTFLDHARNSIVHKNGASVLYMYGHLIIYRLRTRRSKTYWIIKIRIRNHIHNINSS
ncbi:hypothetical protein SAMN06298214_0568 [Bacteroidales bacterium WCE2004]|nr:hypothetical protein SAMN06298214_0568 [Bacteroidales bacterium WCE2004]